MTVIYICKIYKKKKLINLNNMPPSLEVINVCSMKYDNTFYRENLIIFLIFKINSNSIKTINYNIRQITNESVVDLNSCSVDKYIYADAIPFTMKKLV